MFKMNKIGIRVSPKEVFYCIYDEGSRAIINIDKIGVPLSLEIPEQLKYIRLSLLDIIREYNVEKAGIRTIESNAQSPSISRIHIEGVIQEALASSDVDDYYVGQISNISARIKIERTEFKPLVDGSKSLDGFEGWEGLSKEQREAVLCAIGA